MDGAGLDVGVRAGQQQGPQSQLPSQQSSKRIAVTSSPRRSAGGHRIAAAPDRQAEHTLAAGGLARGSASVIGSAQELVVQCGDDRVTGIHRISVLLGAGCPGCIMET
jgi:hypothetical protein